ncbi:MAG: PD-(D/E)XK nuclease domain-containing protein [Spirochaetaceae bacterium]|nr:PD-(D/E)XK nuclease domain-containing protein [Spirochaetaceae bacterium]
MARERGRLRGRHPPHPGCGRIGRLYCDNGSPFVSTQTRRILDSLGLIISHSRVGKPAGRGKIERFFRTVRQQFLAPLDIEELGGEALYRLGYPNREVRQNLNEHLLRHLVQDMGRQMTNSIRLARLLEAHDCAGLEELFQAFFASIPYEWHTSNDIANYEGYYASVFYSYFAALGHDIVVEESSSHGRLDMAVRTGGHVYLFEFKVVEMSPPGSALAQLQERDCAAKYRDLGQPIHLIGVEFSRETRNVTASAAPASPRAAGRYDR